MLTVTRRRLLGGGLAGVAGAFGTAKLVRTGASSAALSGTDFTRTSDPPLTVTVPDGWLTNDAWMNQDTRPIPIIAIQNRGFELDGDEDDSLSFNELNLPDGAAVLTVMGVELEEGVDYMAATASPDNFSAADAPLVPSGVGEVLKAFAWVTRPDIRWGYLIYACLGPNAGLDATLLPMAMDSLRFSA